MLKRIFLMATLSAFSSYCSSATCDADLVSSQHLEGAKYRFRFSVQMSNCRFAFCTATIKYNVLYSEILNGSPRPTGKFYLGAVNLGNGEKMFDDEVFVGDARFNPKVRSLEILSVSCPEM
ncbi:hypothetical protein [Burkholderia sp. Bp8998]|uniref:hypothetical protein n=1 Tax=Burkholderia sp. Bp8998 TaxID=2184557 RepID=UPI000F5A008D|nr:hypothetical protein [Burkholderia sp. Bp8998]